VFPNPARTVFLGTLLLSSEEFDHGHTFPLRFPAQIISHRQTPGGARRQW